MYGVSKASERTGISAEKSAEHKRIDAQGKKHCRKRSKSYRLCRSYTGKDIFYPEKAAVNTDGKKIKQITWIAARSQTRTFLSYLFIGLHRLFQCLRRGFSDGSGTKRRAADQIHLCVLGF